MQSKGKVKAKHPTDTKQSVGRPLSTSSHFGLKASKQQQNILGRIAHARSNITRMATAFLELHQHEPTAFIEHYTNGKWSSPCLEGKVKSFSAFNDCNGGGNDQTQTRQILETENILVLRNERQPLNNLLHSTTLPVDALIRKYSIGSSALHICNHKGT